MEIFISEFIGCFFLLLLGSGVVANVVLSDTKGSGSGFLAITVGWAIAVFVGVYASTPSGSHINPAVSIAMAVKGDVSWVQVPYYLLGQLVGCFVGSAVAWMAYKPHFDATSDSDLKLAVFSTSPAIVRPITNFIAEAIGTFTLMAGILYLPDTTTDLGHLNPLPVALLVLGIGLSLGGPTGYAINPARDLGPRIAHYVLPIKGKRDSDWSYSWIPVLAPIVGAVLAVLIAG